MFGQGMYCVADSSATVTPKLDRAMEHYIDRNARYGGDVSTVETMTMRNGSRIIDYDELAAEYAKNPTRFGDSRAWFDEWMRESSESLLTDAEYEWLMHQSGAFRELTFRESNAAAERLASSFDDGRMFDLGQALDDFRRVKGEHIEDIGAYAVKRGYDGIIVSGHGKADGYFVVLNRTKLIIRRPE